MRRRTWCVFLLTVFAASASAGAQSRGQEKAGGAGFPRAQTKPAASTRAVPAGAAQKKVSEHDCRQFAQAVVQAVAAGDSAAFNTLIDWDSILKTATAGLGIPDREISELIRGMRTSVVSEGGLASQLIQNSQAGGQFAFIRTREKHERQVVLFRFLRPTSQGGVSYYEFAVNRGPDGASRAEEVWPYGSAEYISTTIRRMVLPLAASKSRTFLDKLLTDEQDYVRDFPKLVSIIEAMKAGKMKEAVAQLKELRPETRKNKSVLLLRLRAAQEADDQEYAATLTEFRKLFPKDPCLDLLSIDYYTINKDFTRALECIDQLEESVGGDPYLTFMRAGVVNERGDRAEARRLANLAIDREPSLQAPYFLLVGLSLEEKRYDETLALLKKLHATLNVKFDDLTKVPDYAGFAKSPQHAKWLKYLEDGAKEQKRKQDERTAPGALKEPSSAKPESGSGD
jgi:hypothetical protein